MKLLAINALSALQGGGQTYLINLLDHLPEGDVKIVLLVNSKNKDIFEQYQSEYIDIYEVEWASKNIIYRCLWEIFVLPSYLQERKIDVYYAPGGVMITRMPKTVTSVTALQNMLPFNEQERKRFPLTSYIRFRLWLLRYVFLKSYRIAGKVIFISENSKSVVKNYYSDIEEKSIVIPHGLNSDFLSLSTSLDIPVCLTKNKFYLYVSILDVYKAQKEIIKAWKILSDDGFEYPLVLAGQKYNDYGEEVLEMINELGLQGKVIYLGKVDYEKLPGLYQSARALVFASSCECCPNILLEKLAAGKPVLCSNIEPMPEFGEDAVLYFDPYEPSTLVELVNFIENDENKMKEFSKKARIQASKFDWSKTVKKTIDFFFDDNARRKNV